MYNLSPFLVTKRCLVYEIFFKFLKILGYDLHFHVLYNFFLNNYIKITFSIFIFNQFSYEKIYMGD